MKTWAAFFPDVLPQIPEGIPDPTVEHRLMRSAQVFCERTRAWRVDMDAIATVAGVNAYDLELPVATELVRLERATLDGHDIALWRTGEKACGRYVFTPEGKTVQFSTAPAGAQSLVLNASLRPGSTAKGVEDDIFDRYAQVIAMGAVAYLANNATSLAGFDHECARINTAMWRGNAAVRPRARPNFF